MANTNTPILNSALGTYTTAIAGAASAPTLKNMAAAARVLGNAVAETPPTNSFAHFALNVKMQSAPLATANTFSLYLLPSADGTNYADGSDTVVPAKALWVCDFELQLNTNAQYLIRTVDLPAGKWKPLLVNNTGYSTTNVDGDNVLSYATFNQVY